MKGGGSSGLRAAGAAAGIVALLSCIVTATERHAGAQAMADSDAAAARGDVATATFRARDAAESVAPGSPYPHEGYARLEAIARAAEMRHDERAAIAAWGAMRGAATATSAPLWRTGTWRAMADEGLIRASAPKEASPGEVHASEDTLRSALTREDAPGGGILALLGAGVVALVVGFGRVVFAARDVSALKHEKIALATAIAGALLYAFVYLRG